MAAIKKRRIRLLGLSLILGVAIAAGCSPPPPDAAVAPPDSPRGTSPESPDATERPAGPVEPAQPPDLAAVPETLESPESLDNKAVAPRMSELPPPAPPAPRAPRAMRAMPPGDAPGLEESTADLPREKLLYRTAPGDSAEANANSVRHVDVFYATDRAPLQAFDPPGVLSRYGPVAAAGLITCVFAVGAWFFSRRILLAIVVFGGVLIMFAWHQANQIEVARLERLARNGNRAYGNARHETAGGYRLEVGLCEVTIPPQHSVGKLEAPSIFKLEFRETPEKHVVLQRITCVEEATYYRQLHDRVAGSNSQQAMVFVHGYNVRFDDAVKRTAQIAFDLGFDGAPICYSWPSLGGLSDYTRDENNVEWTVVHLEDFLNRVARESGAKMIHLVAHSMGNRALLQTLERMAPRRQAAEPLFGQIVLAAPDVDASAFRERYAPTAVAMARQVTLYASSSDKALQASTKVHGQTRAGLAGEHLIAIPGVETVDVSAIDTSFLGHSYYGNNPLLIKDLHALVELGAPASDRSWLEKVLRPPSAAWWCFKPGAQNQPAPEPPEL